MKREFLINIGFLILINLLIKPFYIFGIDRSVQNEVGPEAFGLYWAIFNFVYLFQVLNDFGLQNFSSTYISQNRLHANKYFGHIATVKVLFSLAFIIVVGAFAVIIGYSEYLWPLLTLLVVNQILVSAIFFLRANLAGLGKYRLDSLSSVLDKSFMIIICGLLLWGPWTWTFTILHFIVAQSISLLLAFGILLLFVGSALTSVKLKWHGPTLMAFVKRSAPFALTFILTAMYTRVDSVMLERLLSNGAYEAGVYVSGFRLLEASNMLIYLFIGLLLPMLSFLHKNQKESENLFLTGFKMIWVIGLVLGILTVVYRHEIMTLLYEYVEYDWGNVMALLMAGFLGMALAHVCGAFLLAKQKVHLCNWVYAIGMVFNIGVNLYLIPLYGAMGAALATLLTQYLVALASFYLVHKELHFRISGKDWFRVLLFGIIIISFALIPHDFTLTSSWIADFILFGLFFAVIALIMGLLPWKDLLQRTTQ